MGWRGGSYYELSEAQAALAKLFKGTEKGGKYKEESIRNKSLALKDYKELVPKAVKWVNKSIDDLEKELNNQK